MLAGWVLVRRAPTGPLLLHTTPAAQVEADIQPFRGILLGLFFVKTGSSLDVSLLIRQWPIVLTLLGGLLALKTTIITVAAQWFGLTRREAVRVGFGLSQVRPGVLRTVAAVRGGRRVRRAARCAC
jgi:Kef-type K+ transport system membrane component KefB